MQGEVEYAVPPLAEAEAVDLFCARSRLEPTARDRRALPPPRRPAARGRARRRPHEALSPAADPRAAGAAARPAPGRPRRRPAPADAAGDNRVVVRPAHRRGAAALRAPLGLRRRLHARGRRRGRDADLDTLQSLVEKSLVRFTAGATGCSRRSASTRRSSSSPTTEGCDGGFGPSWCASPRRAHAAAHRRRERDRRRASRPITRTSVPPCRTPSRRASPTTSVGSSARSIRSSSRTAIRPRSASGRRRRSPPATGSPSAGSPRRSSAEARSPASPVTSTAPSS